MNKFISKSEQDTINFAENFANQLHKKEVIVNACLNSLKYELPIF